MDEIYSDGLSEREIEDRAQDLIIEYGENALAEAQKEISLSNARGNFTLSGSWVRVCQRIRLLQDVNGYKDGVNGHPMLSD